MQHDLQFVVHPVSQFLPSFLGTVNKPKSLVFSFFQTHIFRVTGQHFGVFSVFLIAKWVFDTSNAW
jgi:hypothetical protein